MRDWLAWLMRMLMVVVVWAVRVAMSNKVSRMNESGYGGIFAIWSRSRVF